MRRDAENADDIIWIEAPDAHYCYHFVNASQDDDQIIIHASIWDDMDFDLKLEHPDEVSGDGPWLKRLVFDLTTKEMIVDKLLD